jgi:hypothetical protein
MADVLEAAGTIEGAAGIGIRSDVLIRSAHHS